MFCKKPVLLLCAVGAAVLVASAVAADTPQAVSGVGPRSPEANRASGPKTPRPAARRSVAQPNEAQPSQIQTSAAQSFPMEFNRVRSMPPPVYNAYVPAEHEWAKVPLSVVPRRELEFDQSEKETPVPLDVSQPDFLDQRYAVDFDWDFPAKFDMKVDFKFYSRSALDISTSSRPWQLIWSANRRWNVLLAEWQRELPSELQLPTTAKQAVSAAAAEHFVFARLLNANQTTHFRIMVPTAERARHAAESVVSAIDLARLYPAYASLIAAKERSDKELEGWITLRKRTSEELKAYEKELEQYKDFADISREGVVNFFVTQQRLISVDLAGIKARIGLCDKILERREGLTATRIEQVETVKTAAEIELVGIAAKRNALEDITTKGRRRLELLALQTGHIAISGHYDSLIRNYEAARDYAKPLWDPATYFGKVGKVTIRRIRWETPKQQ